MKYRHRTRHGHRYINTDNNFKKNDKFNIIIGVVLVSISDTDACPTPEANVVFEPLEVYLLHSHTYTNTLIV